MQRFAARQAMTDKGYSLTWNKGKLQTLTGRDGRNIPLEVHSYVPMLKNEVDKSYIVQEMAPGSEGQGDPNPTKTLGGSCNMKQKQTS